MMQLGKAPTISLMMLLLVSTITPAFSEVTSFELDKIFYTKGDQISFSGTVNEESKGLITIVIRDSNEEFVLLTQAYIQPDNTFQRSLDTDKKFDDHGIHNATAFILDLTKGKTASFDFSQDGTLPVPSITSMKAKSVTQNEPITEENNSIPQTNSEPNLKNDESTLAGFVDPSKDPQYYLDRYYNEPTYKEWFDNNYPGLTIEGAVGLESVSSFTETIEANLENVIPDEVIPEAEAIQTVDNPFDGNSSESNEIALLGLTLGGLAILFGAIYRTRRKVDTNYENTSKNRESIKKKIIGTLHWNNPEDVIKNRLAFGEITVKEYSAIKKVLEK